MLRALGLLLASAPWACKKSASPAEPAPSATPAPANTPSAAARCKELRPGSPFLIGERGTIPPAFDGDDVDVEQPFAVEIGAAVPFAGGFAVSALRTVGGGTGAVVALIGADGAGGRLIDLGRVHGDVEPPQLAARDSQLFAVVSDNDASSATLRLAALQTTKGARGVLWGGEQSSTRDESFAFGVEVGESRGVMVWDEYDKQIHRGVIRLTTFDPANPSTMTEPRVVSPQSDDAETPELAARPGGFWLAWVSHASAEVKQAPKAARAGARNRAPDAGASSQVSDLVHDEPVLDTANRSIRIVPLDKNGSPLFAPIAVTSPDRHVLVFDLASLSDGSAMLAWRDDPTTPGVESRIVHLARVRGDGSVDKRVLDDEDVGAGAPSLLPDPHAGAGAPLWLALESVTDSTRLAPLAATGALLDGLQTESIVQNAEPLALRQGKLLLARSRGLAAELSVVDCKPSVKSAH